MSVGVNRSKVAVSTIFVIGILLIGTGLFLFVFDPLDGPGNTTSTTTTTPPPLAHNPYQVAIVFATGGLGDKSFNDGVYGGVLDAHFDHNINFTYVEPTQISDYEVFLRGFAQHAQYVEPYDLIIAVGFDQDTALQTIANEFTDQKFAIVDMFIDPIVYPNVASLLFDEHEGSALVGAIAGLTTTTDKIGFIGGVDIPLINKYAAGYVFGAAYVNPQLNGTANILANVSIGYTGDWVDTTTAQTLADGMFDAGADIIFAAAGRAGLGVIDSVKDKNTTSSEPLWCIGVDSPQMYLGTADPNNPVPPTLCLSSMLKRVDVAVYTIIEDWVVDSTWATGFGLLYSFDLANGGVGYEVNTDLLTLPPVVISTVEAFKALIIAGTVVVPDAIYWP
ncbi:MAG: BMP family ABC transporter substrate-binding protein [Candidatus Thorarchaeota archaeon]|nr:BMP family ABC transporter substrate-binding protein [Candidatus Thorarchaeota archaeon]